MITSSNRIASIGHGVDGVSDVREDWGVVNQRTGGGDHSAASSQYGRLSISRSLSENLISKVIWSIVVVVLSGSQGEER